VAWAGRVHVVSQSNSALGACILKYALGYNEPPPMVKVNDEEQPDHALQRLLERPNPLMSHAELKAIDIIYRIFGGNTYLHKVRGGGGQVVELWPYHAGQMWSVPSRFGWVEEYEYDAGHGKKKRIPAADIIHLKWPIIDLSAPWRAVAPLVAIAREVMTDAEAARFAYALLHNDAIPRGVVTLPEGTAMSPKKAEDLRNKFRKDHGGDNRGGVVILEQGAGYTRVSMNPQEMDLSALRRVPEARIAGNLGMSPMVGHLTAGLERSTYSNAEQAYREVVQGTFVPMWRSDGNELTQALQSEYPDKPTIAYNTSLVASLQESTDDKYNRTLKAFDSNVTMLDEARALIDLPPVDQVIQGDTRGKLFSFEMVNASTIAPPQPRIIDAIVEPRQIEQEDEQE
jgi:HK97 family phage portal protein